MTLPAGIAVALLGERDLAGRLGQRLGVTVAATSPADQVTTAERLAEGGAHLVVGLSSLPWPNAADVHARASASVPGYTGVVSWHGLPGLHRALAEVARPAVAAGAHLLVTAPDPGPDTDPADLVFLREVASALHDRLPAGSSSIAWRGADRTPTAEGALTSVVQTHGRRDVVECPVAPGTAADPALLATAEQLGARLTCADLGIGTLLDLLADVVATVSEHELGDPGHGGESDRSGPPP